MVESGGDPKMGKFLGLHQSPKIILEMGSSYSKPMNHYKDYYRLVLKVVE